VAALRVARLGEFTAKVLSAMRSEFGGHVENLDDAVLEYASILPAQLDLVHLGLGPDGHTASLIPDDPVLDVDDQLIAMTGPYQGHPRMTMTYLALALADQLLWLVTGADKRIRSRKLLDGDTSIPAGRVVGRPFAHHGRPAAVHRER
jgi:6-phosphogluconolactonase/glucosamine-6-phosphate isomerase/deaminase